MKIGHTGITWGIPGDVEQAYRDTAELGYLGFETFAATILRINGSRPGGYRGLVDSAGIPTAAAYCYKEWISPDTAAADMESARREADALRDLPGGETLVLQAGPRPKDGYTPDQFRRLADALNRVGDYCRGIGLAAGLHPHTGTAIETPADIDAILGLLDPALIGFAPDTGQIAKGGSHMRSSSEAVAHANNILEVMRAHRTRIVHVHLKDWNGHYERDADGREIDRSGYVNYEPVGSGVLPMPEIFAILFADGGFDGWVNVELDGTPRAPRPAREAASISRHYLASLLGDDVAWTC